jgi:hypothetical protein
MSAYGTVRRMTTSASTAVIGGTADLMDSAKTTFVTHLVATQLSIEALQNARSLLHAGAFV